MTKLGVVVGRFQIDEPHEGHLHLLDTVKERSDGLLITLGSGPLPTSCRKPLPFHTRRTILNRLYPNAFFAELHDHPDDQIWSEGLDHLIKTINSVHFEGSAQVTLYHSRDSFKEHYSGRYNTVEVTAADLGVSGTLHRKQIAKHPLGTQDFARGVIWANENKFPTVYSTVDIAAFDSTYSNICLITKRGVEGLMFPGGFADPGSISDEGDAVRELREETSLPCKTGMEYIGSLKVTDWRYASEPDEIRTRMFVCRSEGDPVAGDDAETAKWYNYENLMEEDFNQCHRPLFRLLTLDF